MNLRELSKRRKTVRKFKNDKPSLDDIKYALNVLREAPSGKNDQPWLFLLVSSEDKKERIKDICEKGEKNFYNNLKGDFKKWLNENGFSYKKPFLSEAPYLLMAFSYNKSPFAKESLWLSIGYLLLALEEKNLSTVTYTPSNFKEISDFLNTPKDYKLEVILPIGYSKDNKPKYNRKSIDEILYYEDF